MPEINNDIKKVYDCCVLCGKTTCYTKDVPFDERQGYIEGAGQLCPSCYMDIYLNKKRIAE